MLGHHLCELVGGEVPSRPRCQFRGGGGRGAAASRHEHEQRSHRNRQPASTRVRLGERETDGGVHHALAPLQTEGICHRVRFK